MQRHTIARICNMLECICHMYITYTCYGVPLVCISEIHTPKAGAEALDNPRRPARTPGGVRRCFRLGHGVRCGAVLARLLRARADQARHGNTAALLRNIASASTPPGKSRTPPTRGCCTAERRKCTPVKQETFWCARSLALQNKELQGCTPALHSRTTQTLVLMLLRTLVMRGVGANA
jgi:hypothetical protein